MSPQFKLWTCPFFSLEEKQALDPIGLPPEEQSVALQQLLIWMSKDQNTPLQNQESLFKHYLHVNPALNLFEPHAEGLFNLALQTQNDRLVRFFLQQKQTPLIEELNRWTVESGIYKASKSIRLIPLLNYLAEHDLVKSMKTGLEKGLFVDVRDKLKHTPLHHAQSIAAVELLLQNGANPSVKNESGLYPESTIGSQNKDDREKMKHLILSARAQNIQKSEKKTGQIQMEKKLFSSIWQDDEVSFNAYLNAIAQPIESFKHPQQNVNMLVWSVRRHLSSSSANTNILKKVLTLWPLESTSTGKDLAWSDKMWLWMMTYFKPNGHNPARTYWKNQGWSNSTSLSQLIDQLTSGASQTTHFSGSLQAVYEKAWIGFIREEFFCHDASQTYFEIKPERLELFCQLAPSLNQRLSEWSTSMLFSFFEEVLSNPKDTRWSQVATLLGTITHPCETTSDIRSLAFILEGTLDCSAEQASVLAKSSGFIGWEKHFPEKAAEFLGKALHETLPEASLSTKGPRL